MLKIQFFYNYNKYNFKIVILYYFKIKYFFYFFKLSNVLVRVGESIIFQLQPDYTLSSLSIMINYLEPKTI